MTTEEYEETEKKSRRFCDIDGCEKGAPHSCCHCGRDLCGWCGNSHASIDPYDPDDNSDYRDWTCEECQELGVSFKEIIDECREKEYNTREEWDKLCKSTLTSSNVQEASP